MIPNYLIMDKPIIRPGPERSGRDAVIPCSRDGTLGKSCTCTSRKPRDETTGKCRDGTLRMPRDETIVKIRDGTRRMPRDATISGPRNGTVKLPRDAGFKPPGCIYPGPVGLVLTLPCEKWIRGRTRHRWRKRPDGNRPFKPVMGEVCSGDNENTSNKYQQMRML
jgi:hypothetical protein